MRNLSNFVMISMLSDDLSPLYAGTSAVLVWAKLVQIIFIYKTGTSRCNTPQSGETYICQCDGLTLDWLPSSKLNAYSLQYIYVFINKTL